VLLLFIVNESAGEKCEIVNSAAAITSRDQKASLFAPGLWNSPIAFPSLAKLSGGVVGARTACCCVFQPSLLLARQGKAAREAVIGN